MSSVRPLERENYGMYDICFQDHICRIRRAGMGFVRVLEWGAGQGFEAIVTAARLRFRPILMTSIAALLGTMPLMLATGALIDHLFQHWLTPFKSFSESIS